jgi:hypothetical protein
MEDRAGLLRVFGLREIATEIGILSQRRPALWLWARVGGDILDLVALGSALMADNARRSRVGIAAGAVAVVTVLDVMCGQQLSSSR